MTRRPKDPSAPTESRERTAENRKTEYLNTKQAAAYLGVSKSFLEKRRQKTRPDLMRQSPAFHEFVRSIRYEKFDLDHWREARRFNPEGPANG
jgi:hypothetical protein